MGGIPGVVAQIQSWSQELLPHLHTHCIVTGGGLTEDGRWVRPKRQWLLPRKVLMKKFRGKMRYFLIKLAQKAELNLPPGISKQRFINLLNKLGRAAWNVKILPPYSYADGVATYLGRYIKGGPIKDNRFISFGADSVTFRLRPTKQQPDRKKVTLLIDDFIRRLLLHVPVPRAQYVRSFGLYANTCREKLEKARKFIGQMPLVKTKPLRWQDILKRFTARDPELCPLCAKPLIRIPILPLAHSPPRYAIETQYIKTKATYQCAS